VIDISRKITTLRIATAEAILRISADTLARIAAGTIPKGNPYEVAKVAAAQAAKNTSDIIPYCHPLPIEFVGVDYVDEPGHIRIQVTVKAIHKTGVEMEALTAATVAALTIYDMCKFCDETMAIESVRLLEKRGGKSDFHDAFKTPLRAGVLIVNDAIAAGRKDDEAGRAIRERLEGLGVEIAAYAIVADEPDAIEERLRRYCDDDALDLVLTSGGTGCTARDCVPEITKTLLEREIPGVVEAMRNFGQDRTPYAMFSRGHAGIRGRSLIVNLPGSRRGAKESLDSLLPALLHAFRSLQLK
jgi:cyclic pyranopterin monophosphate synthase